VSRASYRYLVQSSDAAQGENMTEAVRLRVVVPNANTVVEDWYSYIVPDGVSVLFARMLIVGHRQ
jgi:hypothetical protein